MARDYDLPDRNVQNATLLAIIDRDYRPTLPPIHPDTWERIVKGTTRGEVDLNERLEFVGDALLYICVALELRKLYPESMPHFLTVLRQVLVTNLILSLIVEKIDPRTAKYGSILEPVIQYSQETRRDPTGPTLQQRVRLSIGKDVVKSPADCMEMAIGALYYEQGFESVHQWCAQTYAFLLPHAAGAYGRNSWTTQSKLITKREAPAPRLTPLRENPDAKRMRAAFDSMDSQPPRKKRKAAEMAQSIIEKKVRVRNREGKKKKKNKKNKNVITSSAFADEHPGNPLDHSLPSGGTSRDIIFIDLTGDDDEDDNYETTHADSHIIIDLTGDDDDENDVSSDMDISDSGASVQYVSSGEEGGDDNLAHSGTNINGPSHEKENVEKDSIPEGTVCINPPSAMSPTSERPGQGTKLQPDRLPKPQSMGNVTDNPSMGSSSSARYSTRPYLGTVYSSMRGKTGGSDGNLGSTSVMPQSREGTNESDRNVASHGVFGQKGASANSGFTFTCPLPSHDHQTPKPLVPVDHTTAHSSQRIFHGFRHVQGLSRDSTHLSDTLIKAFRSGGNALERSTTPAVNHGDNNSRSSLENVSHGFDVPGMSRINTPTSSTPTSSFIFKDPMRPSRESSSLSHNHTVARSDGPSANMMDIDANDDGLHGISQPQSPKSTPRYFSSNTDSFSREDSEADEDDVELAVFLSSGSDQDIPM